MVMTNERISDPAFNEVTLIIRMRPITYTTSVVHGCCRCYLTTSPQQLYLVQVSASRKSRVACVVAASYIASSESLPYPHLVEVEAAPASSICPQLG